MELINVEYYDDGAKCLTYELKNKAEVENFRRVTRLAALATVTREIWSYGQAPVYWGHVIFTIPKTEDDSDPFADW